MLSGSAHAEPQALTVGDYTFWIDELPNGLQSIAIEDTSADTVSVFVVYSVGNRMESAETHGLAHLTEHIAFSGTESVPLEQLISIVEGYGGEANAYTRDDYTAYYDHRVPLSALPEVLSLEADRMRNIAFDLDAFAYEQGRLRDEEAGTNIPGLQLKHWRRAAVLGGQSYGAGAFDASGNSQAPGLDVETVRSFYNRWYQPQRAAVVVIGPSHTTALSLISDAFSGIPAGQETPDHARALSLVLPTPQIIEQQTDLTRQRNELVWVGPSLDHPEDRVALELLAALNGGRTSASGAPLEVLIDEMLGSSLFILAASGEDASSELATLVSDVRAADVSEERLAAARALLRDRYQSLELRTRPYFSLAVDVAVYARWGIPDYPARYAELVDSTTVSGLREAAARWLDPERAWDIRFLANDDLLAELPTDKQGLYEAGLAAAEGGDLTRAVAAYEALLALGANDMNTVIYRYTLGELNFRLRQYAEARRHLEAGLAVIDYPALRELLQEVNAADQGGAPAVAAEADAPTAERASEAAPSSARVVDTAGEEPAWAAEAGEVMGQLESWRGLPFEEDLVVHFEASAGERVAGYYEPATKRLVVGLSNSERFNRGTMLHEMYHALQDQQFDLSMLYSTSDSIEHHRTLSALIEGEAMLAVSELMDYNFLDHATIPEEGALDVDRYESIFRYGDGQRFIKHLRDVGGWELVSEAFENPPGTTAEIFHPQRYLSGWSPLPPRKLPSLPVARGEAVLLQEAVGEYGLRLFLAGAPETRPLAPTLGAALLGDQHLIVRTPTGERRMAWVLVFADDHSARRFLEAAPAAARAVSAVSGLSVEALGYVRRARGYGVRLSWQVIE